MYMIIFSLINFILSKSLIIIAHPDDDTMFFTPTIQNMLSDLTILCLSTGGYNGKGDVRSGEIRNICNKNNITCILLDIFKDNEDWNLKRISNIIKHLDMIYSYDTIYTFDKTGVSYHKNHVSCHFAALNLIGEIKAKIYFLKTKNIFYKYILDLSTSSDRYFISKNYLKGVANMLLYKSQMVWFRYLYVLFSNYMIVNDYEDK